MIFSTILKISIVVRLFNTFDYPTLLLDFNTFEKTTSIINIALNTTNPLDFDMDKQIVNNPDLCRVILAICEQQAEKKSYLTVLTERAYQKKEGTENGHSKEYRRTQRAVKELYDKGLIDKVVPGKEREYKTHYVINPEKIVQIFVEFVDSLPLYTGQSVFSDEVLKNASKNKFIQTFLILYLVGFAKKQILISQVASIESESTIEDTPQSDQYLYFLNNLTLRELFLMLLSELRREESSEDINESVEEPKRTEEEELFYEFCIGVELFWRVYRVRSQMNATIHSLKLLMAYAQNPAIKEQLEEHGWENIRRVPEEAFEYDPSHFD